MPSKPTKIIFYTTGGYTCPSNKYAEVYVQGLFGFGTPKIGEVLFSTGSFASDIDELTMGREPILIVGGQTIVGDIDCMIKEFNKP